MADQHTVGYYKARNRATYRAIRQLIAENQDRYRELLAWARADTPAVCAERREVLFRETATRRLR